MVAGGGSLLATFKNQPLSCVLRCTLGVRVGSIARITAPQHFCPLHLNKQISAAMNRGSCSGRLFRPEPPPPLGRERGAPHWPADVTRQTVFPTSSAIRRAPVLSTATPTGRPRASPLELRNPVTKSSA